METLECGPVKARQEQSEQAQAWLLWGGRIHYGVAQSAPVLHFHSSSKNILSSGGFRNLCIMN